MPSTRDIRRRIVSVKKTAQITSAMEKVAQAKMGRAQQAAMAGRPYAELMNRVLGEVVTHAGDFDHPFMKARGGENRALILVTTDKGMCGSINSNLLRMVSDEFVTDHTRVIAAGRKHGVERIAVFRMTFVFAALFVVVRLIDRGRTAVAPVGALATAALFFGALRCGHALFALDLFVERVDLRHDAVMPFFGGLDLGFAGVVGQPVEHAAGLSHQLSPLLVILRKDHLSLLDIKKPARGGRSRARSGKPSPPPALATGYLFRVGAQPAPVSS